MTTPFETCISKVETDLCGGKATEISIVLCLKFWWNPSSAALKQHIECDALDFIMEQKRFQRMLSALEKAGRARYSAGGKMNAKQRNLIISILVLSLMISGCGPVQFLGPTVTPSATPTLVPTSTPIPTLTRVPTSTPLPTATEVPPTQMPASLGEVISYKTLDISVLDVYRHDNLIPGNGYRYWANPGFMIIDLVVKVQNTGSSSTSITWNDTYALDDSGSRSEVMFGGSRSASKTAKIDPLSIDYNDLYGGMGEVEVIDTVYMRIIYIIPDKSEQKVLFGIGDSPKIEFLVKK